MSSAICRACSAPLKQVFADLRATPLANSLLSEAGLQACEPTYPLLARVCTRCRLVQLDAFQTPEHIFGEYLYFSSYSQSWLDHAHCYTLEMTSRFGIGARSRVIEIGSNDGYLLKNFLGVAGDVLGIEPAVNVARAAEAIGVPTLVKFFSNRLGGELAADDRQADLVVANNVLAHVPDLNDFVAGLHHLLKEDGVLTVEFPHLLELIRNVQFDTIYHEHFSYFSLHAAIQVFQRHGLNVFDVERLHTHGGSLRLFVQRGCAQPWSSHVETVLAQEVQAGLLTDDVYRDFADRASAVKRACLRFLLDAAEAGRCVVGYGAAAKGNTFLNYCGIGTDLVTCVADASPHKQGRYLPGSRIPVVAPEALAALKPDYVLILPWNLCEEIADQLHALRAGGTRCVTAIPSLEVF